MKLKWVYNQMKIRYLAHQHDPDYKITKEFKNPIYHIMIFSSILDDFLKKMIDNER